MKHLVISIQISAIYVLLGGCFIVTRKASYFDSKGLLTDYPDEFEIPDAQCNNNELDCGRYSGQRISKVENCKCVCGFLDAREIKTKSIFWLNSSGQWKCTENTVVRNSKEAVCGYTVNQKFQEKQLTTLPVRGSDGALVSYASGNTWSIYDNRAKSLQCDGTWKALDKPLVQEAFTLSYDNNTDRNYLSYNISSRAHAFVEGKLVQLKLFNSNLRWDPSICVLFKVKGTLICPLPTTQPPTTRDTTPRSTIPTQPPTTTGESQGSTTTDATPRTTTPASTSSPNSSTPVIDTVKDKPTAQNQKTNIQDTPLFAAILGGVNGFIVLLVGIIVLVSMRRKSNKRKRRKRGSKRGVSKHSGVPATLPRPINGRNKEDGRPRKEPIYAEVNEFEKPAPGQPQLASRGGQQLLPSVAQQKMLPANTQLRVPPRGSSQRVPAVGPQLKRPSSGAQLNMAPSNTHIKVPQSGTQLKVAQGGPQCKIPVPPNGRQSRAPLGGQQLKAPPNSPKAPKDVSL